MLSRSRLLAVVFLSLSSVSALASDLTVRVVDPSSAAVSGAQVEIFAGNSSRPLAVDVTSAQGIAHFNHLPDSALRVRVLAAGFADISQSISPERHQEQGTATIALHLAVATETVVVSATRTPVPSDESGA